MAARARLAGNALRRGGGTMRKAGSAPPCSTRRTPSPGKGNPPLGDCFLGSRGGVTWWRCVARGGALCATAPKVPNVQRVERGALRRGTSARWSGGSLERATVAGSSCRWSGNGMERIRATGASSGRWSGGSWGADQGNGGQLRRVERRELGSGSGRRGPASPGEAAGAGSKGSPSVRLVLAGNRWEKADFCPYRGIFAVQKPVKTEIS